MAKAEVLDSRGRPRVQTMNDEPSMTVQSDAPLADIKNIMKQFLQGGQQMLDEADLLFADVSEFTDLADAMNQARDAEVIFMKLPSKVREVFDHDVAVWLDSAHDVDKRDALVAAGYLEKRAVQEVVPEQEVVAERAEEAGGPEDGPKDGPPE